ncbi:hypothetical protein ACFSTC_59340 [Nonomuraea ferruginea]
MVLDPALRLGGGDTAGVYGRQLEEVSISAAVLHWSWVLLIPGIIGMIHLVRHRAVLLGHVTGGIALLGVVNFSALMLGDYFYARLERSLPPAEGAALADQAFADPGLVFGFQIPGFAGILGLFALGLVLAYCLAGALVGAVRDGAGHLRGAGIPGRHGRGRTAVPGRGRGHRPAHRTDERRGVGGSARGEPGAYPVAATPHGAAWTGRHRASRRVRASRSGPVRSRPLARRPCRRR